MGRNLDFLKIPSTNLLYTKVAEWAKERGFHSVNIGGGRTNSDDDSLFKFKKNFSQQLRPFYIGKRIHRDDVYRELIERYRTLHGQEKFQEVKHLLQFYRAQD
jgi:lipid II:glycine glycyltransferase (peptidoglycan interpeptide bridge formation enzyme)